MSLRPLALLITLLSAPTLALAPREVSAQVVVGLDAQAIVGGDIELDGLGEDDLNIAPSVSGRVGFQLPLAQIGFATPELRVGLARVQAGDAESSDLLDARVGGRVGMDRIVQIGVYAHAGWSFIGGDAEEAARDSLGMMGLDSDTNGGFSYDAGLFIDIPVTPLIWVGLHSGYNRTEFEVEARERSGAMKSDSVEGHFQWFDVGVHVSARVF